MTAPPRHAEPAGLGLAQPDDGFRAAVRRRRAAINEALFKAQAGAVGSGPFAGMRLLPETSWADGDLSPKLIGCYEAELHPVIETAATRSPRLVINVGCAEGYYAVGMARLLPQARVLAFDQSPTGQDICRRAASLNEVEARLSVSGACSKEQLLQATTQRSRTLLIVDCESAELDLLDPRHVPSLAHCDMIVECHDFMDRSITPTLRERFAATHDIEDIVEGQRDPNRYAALRHLSSIDRWIAVNENRPETMNWIACWARRAAGQSAPAIPPLFSSSAKRRIRAR